MRGRAEWHACCSSADVMIRRCLALVPFGALLLACGGSVVDKPSAATGDGGTAPPSGSQVGADAAATGPTCRSRGGTTQCRPDEYCKYPTNRSGIGSCGADDSGATCTKRATSCEDNSDPVCGCDGKTYENECEAEADGISVRHWAACGSFRCGMKWCDAHTSYCSIPGSGVFNAEPSCQPLPPSCISSGGKIPTCSCFPPTPCPLGSDCNPSCSEQQADGLPGFTLQAP